MLCVSDGETVDSLESDGEDHVSSSAPRVSDHVSSTDPRVPVTMSAMSMLESLESSHPSLLQPPPTSAGIAAMSPSPMDLLKNPFLLPAHLLALNPNLYAAQLAQIQAAQFLFSKQQTETSDNKNGLLSPSDSRKRSLEEEDSPLDLGSKAAKYPKSSPSSPSLGHAESPLDLSGSKSPEVKREGIGHVPPMFNPLLPPNLLSLFNQMQHSKQAPSPDLASMAGLAMATSPPAQRGSPWQSQWISKTSEGTRIEDVFKCVWCKESYQTLEALTTHMKEAKHHSSMPYPLPSSVPMRPGAVPQSSSPLSRTSVSMSSPTSMSPSPKPAPARDILKEQLPIPRKLVRGQDVWIGRADQQTKDILKCMSCGESFRSLELLTKHMQETQHYKKVISHDQISAWKYPDAQQQPNKNHVNSVLSCKVCDKGFSSLKDLSDHMVKANHYTVEANKMASRHPPAPAPPPPNPNLAKDRKKALPVKKLLELERARHELGAGAGKSALNSARDIMESGKLVCERCEEKIPLDFYISHIQQCVGRPRFSAANVKTEKESVDEKNSENENKKTDSNPSILGSLEQLVKGNLLGTPPKRQSVAASPPSSLPSKFSIQNMFQKECPSSPGSSVVSPSSSRPGSQPSGEKLSEASPAAAAAIVVGEQTNGKVKEESEEEENGGVNGDHNDDKDDNDTADDNGDTQDDPDSSSPPPLVAKLSLSSHKDDESTKSGSPLAALQMLCDTQKKTPKTPKIQETTASDPGSMLAFSWACNQPISSDSVIKCPFCDTPFVSKGAYRHHLSKMHFTKEAGSGQGGSSTPLPANVRTPSPDSAGGESLQTKYQKYAQLAKQLSCNQK